MKLHSILISLTCSAIGVHVNADSKVSCEHALQSMGYSLSTYVFEEAGWLSKEKHIFNGALICYIENDGDIHSIEDNGVVVAEDGFFGQEALDQRNELNEERRRIIRAEKSRIEQEKDTLDREFESAKGRINSEFDKKIEQVRLESEPPVMAEAREKRAREIEAARKTEEERLEREKAEAEEEKRRLEAARKTEEERLEREKAEAEEEKRRLEAIARQTRELEVDNIRRRTGSTVSLEISGAENRACADLLAGHIEDIDVHHVQSESIWGGKYTVWYRDRYTNYGADQYSTRKCQIRSGAVKILSVFESWD